MEGHCHLWKIVGHDYTPRVLMEEPSTPKGETSDVLCLTCGATHVYLRCSGCGEFKCQSVPGKVPLVALSELTSLRTGSVV